MKSNRTAKRGSQKRDGLVFVGAWVPGPMATAIDSAVVGLDLDRSKFLRRALEEKIAAVGGNSKS